MKLPLVIVIILLLGGLGSYLLLNQQSSEETNVQNKTGEVENVSSTQSMLETARDINRIRQILTETEGEIIEITDNGFSPSSVNIKKGTVVHFINLDSTPHWPASDVYPTHKVCSGLDATRGINYGEVFSFLFNFESGRVCPIHDHLNQSIKGSISIE